jgi:hypothetical protein
MLLQVFLAAERARAFQHQVHVECLPGQADGVPPGEHRNLPAADDKGITVCGDGRVPAAIDGVIPQQVGQVVRGDQVIDRDHLGAGGLLEDLERRVSDAAQAVDRDAGHGASPLMFLRTSFPLFMVTAEACSFLAAGPRGRSAFRDPGSGA